MPHKCAMKKPQYTKYSVFSMTFSGAKSSAHILKKEFLEVACSLKICKQYQKIRVIANQCAHWCGNLKCRQYRIRRHASKYRTFILRDCHVALLLAMTYIFDTLFVKIQFIGLTMEKGRTLRCALGVGYRLMSKFMFMISLMARASSVMLASPWMVCLMTELATAKFTMSMGL